MQRLTRNQHPLGNRAVLALAYVVVYVLLDGLSYVQPVLQLGITPWRPQAGLTLTFLILCGYRWAPLTVIAALLAEILVRGMPAPLAVLTSACIITAVGSGLSAYVLRSVRLPEIIETPRGVLSLLFVTAAITFLVALLYVVVFRVAGVLPVEEEIRGVRRHWLGDLNGILTLTPVLLAVGQRHLGTEFAARKWEVLAQGAALLLAMLLVFGMGDRENVRLFYVLFAPAVWIAFRWGVFGAALCTLTVQLGLVISVRGEAGYPPVIDLQLLMITLETTGLLLGAVVTQHASARQQIAAREMEQRAILTTAPDGVLSTDAQGRIMSANPAALRLFELAQSELIGQFIAQRLAEVQLMTAQGRASISGMRRDGSSFPADIAWARLEPPAASGFILIIRDATERVLQERRIRDRDTELARVTRFAMLGELASALTHELNQPITALVSYLRAAQILAAPVEAQDPRLPVTLNKAAREAIRTSEILKRLRDFYRGVSPKPVVLSLEEVLSTIIGSYEERCRELGVRIQRDSVLHLPQLCCDQTQLEMILLNLLGNALDAVVAQPCGAREISVTAVCNGADVLLAIEDSGPGLAADVESRLFAPFVTTKADGMGLGLAISRSLLRNQGGDIWTEPAKLGGARFVMRIPTVTARSVANGNL